VNHLLSFSFNKEKKDYIEILRDEAVPLIAPISYELIDIPKRPGAILASKRTGIREISLPVIIRKSENQPFDKQKEEIANWLITDEEKELVLDGEIDRTYFALLKDIAQIREYTNMALTTITFICPVPYKYSNEKSIFIPSRDNNSIYSVENLGSVKTFPSIKLNVKKDLHYFSLITGDDYFQIGEDISVEDEPVDTNALVFHDRMESMAGWGQATFVDHGYLSGEVASDGASLYPRLFGEAIYPVKWQGPAVKKSIGKAVGDFRLEALVDLMNGGSKTGNLEIYLLDSSNRTVAKIGVDDPYKTMDKVRAKARIGEVDTGKIIALDWAKKPEYWNDYKGILRIERINKRWVVYFSTINSKGVHTFPLGSTGHLSYYDNFNEYNNPITQVQVAFRVYPGTKNAGMKVNDLKIYEITPPPSSESVSYIAKAGDTIEIDHFKNTVKKNGELLLGLKDFRSNFFPLQPGRNSITVLPSDAGDVTMTFRERYL
jgi:predicted phage tail component-like protein